MGRGNRQQHSASTPRVASNPAVTDLLAQANDLTAVEQQELAEALTSQAQEKAFQTLVDVTRDKFPYAEVLHLDWAFHYGGDPQPLTPQGEVQYVQVDRDSPDSAEDVIEYLHENIGKGTLGLVMDKVVGDTREDDYDGIKIFLDDVDVRTELGTVYYD